MPTKNPRINATFADKEEYDRVTKFLRREYKSINQGMRAALDALLRKHGEEPLKELEWGGNRTGIKAAKKPKKK